MKRFLLLMIGLGVLIGWGLSMKRTQSTVDSAVETVAELNPEQTFENTQAVKAAYTVTNQFQRIRPNTFRPLPASAMPAATADAAWVFSQAIETLVSTENSFEQKQAAWKRLKESGKIDQAIGELEQRMTNNPQIAEYPAALGQAYLKKCGLTQDIREQAILAMKADQTFDAALDLDPSNWEARFTKAVGLSYWPTNLNKGQEVIEQFQTLIQQQEGQPPQPQFAQAYKWLGDQYQKAGQSDFATQTLERGAVLFPDSEELKRKVPSAQ